MPDMAQSILGHNLESITEQGAIALFLAKKLRRARHAALATGEFYRATTELTLGGYDLMISPRALKTAQAFTLRKLSRSRLRKAWSPSSARQRSKPCRGALMDPTREQLDKLLLERVRRRESLLSFQHR